MSNDNARLIYSTECGKVCPGCAKPVVQCVCKQLKKNVPAVTDGVARVRLETQGRKGKAMTIVSGLPLSENELVSIGKNLKARLGTGGTVKGGVIELQGDHREIVKTELRKHGFSVG
jgi:translation initiation factor 1